MDLHEFKQSFMKRAWILLDKEIDEYVMQKLDDYERYKKTYDYISHVTQHLETEMLLHNDKKKRRA